MAIDDRAAQFRRAQAAGLYKYAAYRSLTSFRVAVSTLAMDTIVTAVKIAAGLGTAEAVDAAEKFLTGVDFASRNNLLLLGTAWAKAGATAQQATIEAYRGTLIRGGEGPYTIARPNRLSGTLGPALESPDFFVASTEGIAFGNLAILNAHAKHWARLNYGAGQRGSSASGGVAQGQSRFQSFASVAPGLDLSGSSNFAEEVLGSGIGSLGPRPGFNIPRGAWMDSTGRPVPWTGVNPSVDQFRQWAAPALRPTKGIAPRRFLDVGVRTLVLAFGDQLVNVVNQWEKGEHNPIRAGREALGVSVKTTGR